MRKLRLKALQIVGTSNSTEKNFEGGIADGEKKGFQRKKRSKESNLEGKLRTKIFRKKKGGAEGRRLTRGKEGEGERRKCW